ncbi:MAG: hypothetical protein ACLGHX_14960 [Acidimicrobiia bacterium]
MAKSTSRTRRCDRQDAAQRYAQARAFAAVAELDPLSPDGPTRSAAVSNSVLAGIAAADAICCRRLGRHSIGDDHQQALALLEEAGDVGAKARRHLETLLSIKNKAQYEGEDPTVAEAKRAIRAMRSMLELASSA